MLAVVAALGEIEHRVDRSGDRVERTARIYVYPNVNHAFNNDTSNRYDKPAADLAWSRTIAYFKANLGAPPA